MFNIITATSEYAAFTVKDYLDRGGKIDIAFLDITLGGIKDGIELDGIVTILDKLQFGNYILIYNITRK